jgi:Ca2+-binding RTX toxin-like protein
VASDDPNSVANTVGTEGGDGGPTDSITSVSITYNGGEQLISLAGFTLGVGQNFTVGGHVFTVSTVTIDGHTAAQVDHTTANTQIGIYTADGYNSLEVSYVSGDTFKIGGFGTTATDPGASVNLTLPLTVTDGDGDVASGMIDATLLPPSPSTLDFSASATGVTETVTATAPNILGSSYDDILNGDAHANTLAGGAGNDTLIGGGGSDILIGGTGNDKFVYNAITDGLDIIKDFSAGDELDFSHTAFGNLAIGGGNTTLDSAHFETVSTGTPVQGTKAGSEFVFNTNDHTLYYDGAGGSYAIAMAKLENGHTLTNSEIHIV